MSDLFSGKFCDWENFDQNLQSIIRRFGGYDIVYGSEEPLVSAPKSSNTTIAPNKETWEELNDRFIRTRYCPFSYYYF